MAALKKKGDLAELKVATDLANRGCCISIPFGEDCDYDLVADASGFLHRVQVKYTESDGEVVAVRCMSHSLTNGKIRQTKHYTAELVDWIAVYDFGALLLRPSHRAGIRKKLPAPPPRSSPQWPAHRDPQRV